MEKVIGDELTEDEEIEDYPCDTTRMKWRTWAVQLVKNAEGQIRKTLHEVFGMRAEKEAIAARGFWDFGLPVVVRLTDDCGQFLCA